MRHYLLLLLVHLLLGVHAQYSTSLNQKSNSFEGADRAEVKGSEKGATSTNSSKSEVVLIVLMSNQNELPVLFDLLKPSVEMAAEYVNSRYSNFRIRVVARNDPSSCEGNMVGAIAAEEYYLRRLDGIIGPLCSRALESAARLASHWGVPIITAGGVGVEFSNKNTYRSLTRIAFSLDRVGDFLSKIMMDYDWHHISMLIDETEPANVLVRSALERTFKAMTDSGSYRTFLDVQEFSKKRVKSAAAGEGDFGDGINYEKYLLNAKKASRVFILLTNGEISRNFLIKAYDLGMNNGEYAFVGVELIRNSGEANDFSWYKVGDKNNRKAKLMYESFLSLAVRVPVSAEYNLFAAKVADRAVAAQQSGTGGKTAAINVNPLVAAFYDAIVIYAWAHNKSLHLHENITHNEKIRKLLWDNVFTDGLTGDLYINENGDRELDYTLSDFSPETGMMQSVLTYYGRRRQVEKNPNVVIHWPGGAAPADVPYCGYSGEALHCQERELIPVWAAILLSLLVAGGSAAAIVWFVLQRIRSEADLASNWWQLDYNEIIFPTHRGGAGGNKSSLSQLTTSDDFAMRSGKASSNRAHTQMSMATSLISAAGQFDSVIVGSWRGIKVAYKPLNIKRITMNRKMLVEFRQIRDTRHENLVRFLGLCMDDVNTAIVTELMIRGSLRDILDEGKLDVDWTFRYSIISDIVEGMIYLHSSPIGFHGRLKSTNCVIDGRFMVKITDYGLRSLHKQVSKEATINPRAFFWTAPEHLRSPDPINHGSKAGDVYAFAVILKEIITRLQPYETAHKEKALEPGEVLDRVRMGIVPPFRPEIVSADCPNSLIKVVNVCWQEEPSKRPDFVKLKPVLRKISRGVSSSNFLDNLLKRMEQYSANLERLVEEKTQLMVEEQARTEELLYQIMPRAVAMELKAGRPIPPELFESVTVFVSDIVGFTVISSMSSPLQVVNLLNDLYSIFDALISQFDAYKIETIGDAYMVASGVPLRNGNQHAKEIALLAIEMLETVDKFTIRHLPKTKLRLRIGVHSGACAAGVVGVKMPKYLVFGETVNTAAFLESTGEPLKIHVSESCKQLLDTFNIFCLSKRGEMETKEKKNITTYWLDSVKIRAP